MTIQTEQLLSVWERGRVLDPVRKALHLLAVAEPGRRLDDLAALPIGERDRRLFAIRESTFGSTFQCSTACPACGAKLESNFVSSALGLPETAQSTSFRMSDGDFELEFRAPNSADLLALAAASDRRVVLLRRCILSAHRGGTAIAFEEIPDSVCERVAEAIRARDPWSAIELAFSCPTCGKHWNSLFDIVSYFWAELQVWAKRMLREVHTIASVYGWRQEEILALHPDRRRAYIELIGQ